MGRRCVMPLALLACSAFLVTIHGPVARGEPARAVVELFTSQGCSACPPADKVLGELARDPSIVAISLPVDYWDYLGWKDTLASPHYSAKQRAYSRSRGDREVYTPQVIVNGNIQVLGSDKAAIDRAIAQTRSDAMTIPVTLSRSGDKLTINVAAAGNKLHGDVWLCGVARSIDVEIGRGENRGRTVTYTNVGRRWLKVGVWTGQAASWTVPMGEITEEDVDAAAVIVQGGDSDKPGPMLGAAFAALR